jgi:hypothetical protein
MNVEWEDVESIAEEAFNIWVGYPEIGWAKRAWSCLIDAHLADGSGPLDRLRSYVRFLVLASLYRDWCAIVWDERHDDEPAAWLSAAEVNLIHVGQLLGRATTVSDDPDQSLDEALYFLMARERPKVVNALIVGLGGVDSLFVEFWRSRSEPDGPGLFEDGDDEDEEEPTETDAEILNDVTAEKMAGYQWLTQGCECLGPERSGGDTDPGAACG